MRKKYLSSTSSFSSPNYSCETNMEGLLIWAVPYAFYRAGAWSNFAVSLNDKGKNGIALTEQFRRFQESL